MGEYSFLEHTADVLFEARGKTFEEALEGAASALFNTVADTSKIRPTKKIKISEKAESLEDLVVFTLSGLLAGMDSEELFFSRLKLGKLARGKRDGKYSISGVASGAPADPTIGRTVVKAVTYHLLRVEKQPDGIWKIRVLLDI